MVVRFSNERSKTQPRKTQPVPGSTRGLRLGCGRSTQSEPLQSREVDDRTGMPANTREVQDQENYRTKDVRLSLCLRYALTTRRPRFYR